MTEPVLFRRPPRRGDPRRHPIPQPVLACRWTVCALTGALTCHWEVVGADSTIAPGPSREREQPPSPIRLAA